MKAHVCEFCNGDIRQRKVTVNHWYEGTLVIIKDVPVGVCGECGHRYYAGETLDVLDALAQNSEMAQERISVPVMVMNS